jgi:hypothetical protein
MGLSFSIARLSLLELTFPWRLFISDIADVLWTLRSIVHVGSSDFEGILDNSDQTDFVLQTR